MYLRAYTYAEIHNHGKIFQKCEMDLFYGECGQKVMCSIGNVSLQVRILHKKKNIINAAKRLRKTWCMINQLRFCIADKVGQQIQPEDLLLYSINLCRNL